MADEAVVGGTTPRRMGRRAAGPRPLRALPATCWDEVVTMPVEVAAPDRESAMALFGEAASHFRAELVEADGSPTVVRLQPDGPAPAGWVFELLALVERWLEVRGLQVANVHHGHRSYVITAPGPRPRWDGSPAPASAA
jgi:hypothetical protein